MNIHDSGAGPRNISDTFTQSLLSGLASSVSTPTINNDAKTDDKWAEGHTKFISPAEHRRTVVDAPGEDLKEPDGYVPVLEG